MVKKEINYPAGRENGKKCVREFAHNMLWSTHCLTTNIFKYNTQNHHRHCYQLPPTTGPHSYRCCFFLLSSACFWNCVMRKRSVRLKQCQRQTLNKWWTKQKCTSSWQTTKTKDKCQMKQTTTHEERKKNKQCQLSTTARDTPRNKLIMLSFVWNSEFFWAANADKLEFRCTMR